MGFIFGFSSAFSLHIGSKIQKNTPFLWQEAHLIPELQLSGGVHQQQQQQQQPPVQRQQQQQQNGENEEFIEISVSSSRAGALKKI